MVLGVLGSRGLAAVMPQEVRKRPLVGSLTTSVSLALIVHGILLLVIIGFTIERVSRPSRLTDSSDSLNSVLLQELKPEDPKSAPAIVVAKLPDPASSPDGVKVAVAIPTAQAIETPKASEFQAKVASDIPNTPPPPKQLGNPAPPKVQIAARNPGTGNNVPSNGDDGAKSGVAAFTNVKGNSAKRIVYVVDGSGSMALCLPFIRAELLRSVARLDASQSFQIVVFRDPPPGSQATGTFILNPRKTTSTALLAASDLNKSILREWLETVHPLGRSSPLTGIETALSMQPDLIFLLSRTIKRSVNNDAEESNRALLERLNALNPINPITRKRPTVIKALQFIDNDPTGLMQAIGKDHGDSGESYKVIPVPEQFRSGVGSKNASTSSLEKN